MRQTNTTIQSFEIISYLGHVTLDGVKSNPNEIIVIKNILFGNCKTNQRISYIVSILQSTKDRITKHLNKRLKKGCD